VKRVFVLIHRGFHKVGDIIIEKTNYKIFIMTLANIFMLIASIAIWILGINESNTRFLRSGIIATILFFVVFIVLISKAAKVKLLLTISREGITDHSLIGSIGFVPFDDIEEFEMVNLLGTRAIGIIPKNRRSFIAKLSPVKQRTARGNITMHLPPVLINVTLAKDMTLEDIYSLLKKRLSDYSRLYD